MKILILCTGNSCRSQMAQAFLRSFDPELQVYSAGTKPAREVHPFAVQVMEEAGISLARHQPKNVEQYLNHQFDYVITVCDHARETCPVFAGEVKHRLHLGFEDPAEAEGTVEEKLAVFRRIRDEIKITFENFYEEKIKPNITEE